MFNYFKKNIIILTPYLDTIGGTEIETIQTAIFFYDSKNYSKVAVFTPNRLNRSIVENLIGDREIFLLKYPNFFKLNFFKNFNKIFNEIGLKINVIEFLYWKYKSFFYQSFFILTYPRSIYFFPVLKNMSKRKKYVAKITMMHFEKLPASHLFYYKKLNNIIVFNKKQEEFWKRKYFLPNVKSLDIMILNEEKLLKLKLVDFTSSNQLKFGFLGRVSKEKNIEAMIKLIAYLHEKKNYNSTLLIQGYGESMYIESLKYLAKELNVLNYVTFINEVTPPTKIHLFYVKIDLFLMTSLHEGGPITALEAAAAGRMILSYDIGAMYDRFNSLPFVVNNSFEELCQSTVNFIELNNIDKNNIALKLRTLYKLKLSNKYKGKELSKVLKMNSEL